MTSAQALVAGTLLLLTLAMLAIGLGWGPMQSLWFQLLLLFSSASAGAAGSTARALWAGPIEVPTARTLVLGDHGGARVILLPLGCLGAGGLVLFVCSSAWR